MHIGSSVVPGLPNIFTLLRRSAAQESVAAVMVFVTRASCNCFLPAFLNASISAFVLLSDAQFAACRYGAWVTLRALAGLG